MLKKLKSLFIVEDKSAKSTENVDEMTEAAADQVQQEQTANDDGMVNSVSAPSTKPSAPSGKVSPKFVDVLLKAIEANNLEGFDYLEFKQSLQNLSAMDMDEQTKYQSAFAMAKTMGVTPSKLVNSAQHYINVLKKEENKFSDALKNQKQKQVVNREQGITQLEEMIVKKQQMIEKLQQEIEADKQKLDKQKTAINESVAKVQATQDGFINAYHSVLGQIQKDIEKMNTYLE